MNDEQQFTIMDYPEAVDAIADAIDFMPGSTHEERVETIMGLINIAVFEDDD